MLTQDSIQECTNIWYKTAIGTLERNNICIYSFSSSIRTLLGKRIGKFRNILVTGPTNCGESFILKPVTKVFNTFDNPRRSSFARVGTEQAEVIFLNGFRRSSHLIPSRGLLHLLEGENVHLPASKAFCTGYITVSRHTNFCHIKQWNEIHQKWNYCWMNWWQFNGKFLLIVTFFKTISKNNQTEINPCPHCFSKLVLSY